MSQPRIVTLVLVTPGGDVLGSLIPFSVATGWWQDVAPVVRGARDRYGVDVTVLRILHSEKSGPPGGQVTYLAEVEGPVPTVPWEEVLDEHPARMKWARPGGPAADLAWAHAALAAQGDRIVGPPEQIRTWNLSSIWRLPLPGRDAWLKAVPPFFAHEGPVLELLQGRAIPTLLARDDCRIITAQIPGADLYGAPLPQLLPMVTLLVRLQAERVGRCERLLELGAPDFRAAALSEAIRSVVERAAPELILEDRRILADFVDGLEARFADVADCGLPDTLVHGDFHPGNLRGHEGNFTLLDWGDCGVGHPLLDQTAFLDRVPEPALAAVREHWAREWRSAIPGSDPERASRLLAPIAAARQAVVYRKFLDNIEPSEHPYHRSDPADWLHRAASLVRDKAS